MSSMENFGMTEASLAGIRRRRGLVDKMARMGITIGGVSVIGTICLIFFYLLAEVMPLFMPASVDKLTRYASPATAPVLYSYLEEQGRMGLVIQADGKARFFDRRTGASVTETTLMPAGIQRVVTDDLASHLVAMIGKDGQVLFAKHTYDTEYVEGEESRITPAWSYPLGTSPMALVEGGLKTLAFRDSSAALDIVAITTDDRIVRKRYERVQSFFTGETELQPGAPVTLPAPSAPVDDAFLSSDGQWLWLLEAGKQIEVHDLKNPDPTEMRHSVVSVLNGGASRITSAALQLGGTSLLLGDDAGGVTQWFMAPNAQTHRKEFQLIRRFDVADAPITTLQAEQRRKAFVAGTGDGRYSLWNTTASRETFADDVAQGAIDWLAMAPRGNALVMASGGEVRAMDVHNEHPEISLSSLWGKVWYENYSGPEHIWQSSSASSDFEPKFSLMPLTFGTLKAAFYAMLFAVPLAVFGAIYTAYFMAPSLRTKVKPAIELMGALPTVILGFLAGLWLAPLVEDYLPAIFVIIMLTPLLCVITAYLWSTIPLTLRSRVPDGWVPLILVPVIMLSVWISFRISVPIEDVFFGGDVRGWLESVGVDFDQRNALVVGIAMGFAVIPIIYSIAEDAIFAVPKALSFGSLALGATPWQTLARVVLPTASPGIFSALMIGMGRAVGETMIVLMAAGNTPIMDFNIFEGLRTLSANIAVEMPEAEIGSTHYRILFLSGLVLFIFTFLLNTTAEMVRQRLRAKYSTL